MARLVGYNQRMASDALRLATFNVRHGRVGRHWPCLPWRLRLGIEQLEADVVGLQEVDNRVFRSWFLNQAELARQAARADLGVFGSARRFGPGGRYGNALVAEGHLLDHEVIELPGRPRAERRVAIVATLELPALDGARLVVANTHLQNHHDHALDQLRFLTERLVGEPEPKVLMGDLNLHPEDVAPVVESAGYALAGGGNSSGVDDPWHRIDHVAVAGLAIESVDVPRPPVSDHRPVIVTARAASPAEAAR